MTSTPHAASAWGWCLLLETQLGCGVAHANSQSTLPNAEGGLGWGGGHAKPSAA